MMAAAHQDWAERLAKLGQLLRGEPMSRHTTMAVGGPADWYFRPKDKQALMQAMAWIPADMPRLPLGRGSNLLVADAGIRGMVIDLGALNAIRLDGCSLYAEAGVRMSRTARLCAEQGLTGLEFLATVPGDMGGGIAMNAGAFGQEIADCLQRIEVVHSDGRSEVIEKEALAMGYRQTCLPPGAMVVSGCFELATDSPDAVRQRIRNFRERRGLTQPLSQPNCGSVFKNPSSRHAARLIEEAGLKGLRIGGARISDVHANFIVNEGEATAADVLALIAKARQEVLDRFDIRLETEVRMVGVMP